MGPVNSMDVLWYFLTLSLFTTYVVLDGFDLGAGLVHLLVARTEDEKRQVLAAIGPYWDGNEVWLIAGGGTLFFAFPNVFASSFSGFYLPLMLMLWCLILRGIAIEFRSHMQHPAWTPVWDLTFGASSILLCILFGAAAGNVIRGVPLDKNGEFFLPLWTDFTGRGELGVLDWYTVLVALLALTALGMHGAAWVALKVPPPFGRHVNGFAKKLWPALVLLTSFATVATLVVQPIALETFGNRPATFLLPIAMLGAILALKPALNGNGKSAFACTSAIVILMMATASATIYPTILPSNTSPELSLMIANSRTSAYGQAIGLIWWIPGMALVIGYFVFLYRRFAGQIES